MQSEAPVKEMKESAAAEDAIKASQTPESGAENFEAIKARSQTPKSAAKNLEAAKGSQTPKSAAENLEAAKGSLIPK